MITVSLSGAAPERTLLQLARTLRHLRGYPQTLMFLAAYLFFNDGIQTVISASSVYGDQQLGFSSSQLIITILLVQLVAFGGALLFGRIAALRGDRNIRRWGQPEPASSCRVRPIGGRAEGGDAVEAESADGESFLVAGNELSRPVDEAAVANLHELAVLDRRGRYDRIASVEGVDLSVDQLQVA